MTPHPKLPASFDLSSSRGKSGHEQSELVKQTPESFKLKNNILFLTKNLIFQTFFLLKCRAIGTLTN